MSGAQGNDRPAVTALRPKMTLSQVYGIGREPSSNSDTFRGGVTFLTPTLPSLSCFGFRLLTVPRCPCCFASLRLLPLSCFLWRPCSAVVYSGCACSVFRRALLLLCHCVVSYLLLIVLLLWACLASCINPINRPSTTSTTTTSKG